MGRRCEKSGLNIKKEEGGGAHGGGKGETKTMGTGGRAIGGEEERADRGGRGEPHIMYRNRHKGVLSPFLCLVLFLTYRHTRSYTYT